MWNQFTRIMGNFPRTKKRVDPFQIEISSANELLSAQLNPKPLILSERHKFWTTSQKENETLNDYSLRIQAMNEFCGFTDFLHQELRDQFIISFLDVQNNIREL
ncbi:hypothetical protein HZS_7520 [Henneguya salminicola]|nr:hypothetical protein HZS_7520 [Henneguya salminicola]